MSKSVLYTANSNSQAVSVNGTINLGSIVRRYGNNVNVSGGNVTITGPGYYLIDSNFSFEADAAGVATITLYKDGVAIPGATESKTVAADSVYMASIPCIVREFCCNQSVITAVISGVPGTFSNAAMVVEKL